MRRQRRAATTITGVILAALGMTTLPAVAQPPRRPTIDRMELMPASVNYGQTTVGAPNWPFLIAEREGFFTERGIRLSKIISGNATATARTLAAGGTDLAQVKLVQLLEANAAGADLVAVAGDTMVQVYTLIVAPPVKTYEDLNGKRLAVAGLTGPLNYVLGRMLAAHGLKPADYELISVGGALNRLEAVRKGVAAGTLLTQPDDFRALAGGLGQLGHSTDYVDHFQYTVTAARRHWVRRNEDVAVRFLRAYVRASRFFHDPKNWEAAVDVLAKETKVDREEALRTYVLYQRTRKTIPQRGEIDLEGARIVAEHWKEFGLKRSPPPIESVIDLTYLNAAQ
jgi:ABC-type nitrate/sulfonate/bicarbonate transport system substrate-binding protein